MIKDILGRSKFDTGAERKKEQKQNEAYMVAKLIDPSCRGTMLLSKFCVVLFSKEKRPHEKEEEDGEQGQYQKQNKTKREK